MGRAGSCGRRSRRVSLRVRRRRAVVGAATLVLVGLLTVVLLGPGRSRPPGARTTGTRAVGRTTPVASARIGRVETTLLAARLPSPLSREAAFALGHGDVLLLGGLTATDTSSNSVAIFDTATGTVSTVGTLSAPTHDAGAAVGGRMALLFGGGQATSVATVQEFPTAGVVARGAVTPAVAHVVGELPGPRSDDVAVAIGATDYVVGGYDGTVGEPSVLATTDGRTFHTVATLPVPVRYPAIAALHGLLYVLGGEAVTGPQAGQPVDDVQVIDPARHTAHLAGNLSLPIEGAAAAVLDGRIYLAGGDANSGQDATSAGTPLTVSTVWRYDPRRGTTTVVAHLPVAVSHAGVAVSGATAWLVGGETDGAVRADVQRVSVVQSR